MRASKLLTHLATFAFIIVIMSCTSKTVRTSSSLPEKGSVLLQEWMGPYGGVPPWDQIRPEEFSAAFDIAMAEAKKEIEAIAADPKAPTFENTFIAMEKSGKTLTRLMALFSVYTSNLNTGIIPQIESEVNPKLAAHSDSITQNSALFARIATIYKKSQSRKSAGFKPAEKRLVENTYKSFVRQGATLNVEQKAQLSKINQELSKLETLFSQNVLNDEKEKVTWLESEADLKGLSPSLVSAYKKAAQDLGKPEKWAVRNNRSAMDPFLTYAENRSLREVIWKTFYSRGDNGDKNDNNSLISQIHAFRTERAKLLGYKSHAHVVLEPRMAKNPENALNLMIQVWPKAVQRVKEEVADMQKLAGSEGAKITIEGWDYRFYAEKVRKAKYALDSNEIRQYLQLEKLVDGLHWMAQEVFGMTFTRVNDVPMFYADGRVYKVADKNGNLIGLWYLDPYARDGKRSGAWMSDYRAQSNMDSNWITPIVSNNSNFTKTDDGKPVLVNWDDAVTLFHEFGHALHGLSSRVIYPSQSGTNVARDYVEFPSQLIEHWLPTKEVLSRFALHFETGAPMPDSLLKKINDAAKFNEGFRTVEYLSAALVDMKLHLSTETTDAKKFEKDTLTALNMPKEIVMRHRMPAFLHLFSGGYEAGYYSYLWSDALTADAAEAFEQNGGYYNQKVAKSLIRNIFSVGDTIDPELGFRKFRGRDVDTKALLRKRGFPVR